MVRQSKAPKNRCVKAIQKPSQTIQIIFIMVERQPVFDDVSVIFTPKGAKPTIANLKHWIPKGIPTMVKQRIKPPIIYSKNINIPPKIIQMILPIKFINAFNLRLAEIDIVTLENETLMLNFLFLVYTQKTNKMKKLTLFAAAAACLAFSQLKAQNVNGVRLSDIHSEYIELKPVYNGSDTYVSLLDYGQKIKREKELIVKDDNNKELLFNSAMDCVNKLKNYGYDLFQAYSVQNGKESSQKIYVLKRK